MRIPLNLALAAGAASLAIAACSATPMPADFSTGPSGGHKTTGAGSATGASGPSSTTTGIIGGTGGAGGSSMSTGSGTVCNHDPSIDGDGDGWTGAEGDCNDCDPNVNPGAVDVPASPGHPAVDEDCDGNVGMPPQPCDAALAIDDTVAMDGAKAIELCQATQLNTTPQMRKWGVLNAGYVRADGSAYAPGPQVGILDNFGPNTHVQQGQRMLALSSGHARLPGQPGACGSETCTENLGVTPPPGFPQDVPGCQGAPNINDDVGLQLDLRTPTNATGYSFSFKFQSFEYPDWVCTNYNDQFIALVNPAPMGAINGNISFDSKNNPVSVNLAYFTGCDPASMGVFACQCQQNGGTCPNVPSPFCPSGPGQLQGTGFDQWGMDSCGGSSTYGGATAWLQTQAPVKGGSEITIRFAIWDTGDQALDSTVLIDGFQWIANSGTVSIGTTPLPQPK